MAGRARPWEPALLEDVMFLGEDLDLNRQESIRAVEVGAANADFRAGT